MRGTRRRRRRRRLVRRGSSWCEKETEIEIERAVAQEEEALADELRQRRVQLSRVQPLSPRIAVPADGAAPLSLLA